MHSSTSTTGTTAPLQRSVEDAIGHTSSLSLGAGGPQALVKGGRAASNECVAEAGVAGEGQSDT